jgi:transposase-like protein
MSALNQPHFQDADKAREYLEKIQWPNGVVCPHCGVVGEHYQITGKSARPGLWKCKDCREQFTVTVGTVFERSKIKLNVWLQAVFLLCTSKKGMSAHQLHRTLGVTYKTAWFMAHRIREAFRDAAPGLLGGGNGGGIVEVDESYTGGKKGRRGRLARKLKLQGTGNPDLRKIVSLVDREGATRSFHIARIDTRNIKPILNAHIAREAKVYTDNAGHYRRMGLAKHYAAHETTNHSAGEYARAGGIHSNTVEAYFGIFKRGLHGTYHHVSEAHLQRYLDEFDFRFTHRVANGVSDHDRTIKALAQIRGKRLTYRRTVEQQAPIAS